MFVIFKNDVTDCYLSLVVNWLPNRRIDCSRHVFNDMKYLFLAFLIIHSCKGRPKLYEVDSYIVRMLLQPNPKEGYDLVDSIHLYNNLFRDVVEKYLHNDETVFRIATVIYNRKGPRFLTKRFNSNLLKETFNWSNQDLENLNRLLEETQSLYNNFCESYRVINDITHTKVL